MQTARDPTERFCNAAAAEFLIPEAELCKAWAEADLVLDDSSSSPADLRSASWSRPAERWT
jgi:Zn-dependent peptidase ImmA (M78 family)